MRATTNIIRIVFLVLAAVTYASPSFAGFPSWTEYCNTYCTGTVRVWQCTFVDYNDTWDTYEGCEDVWNNDPNHTSCCGEEEWGDQYHEAKARYWQGCNGMAGGGGMWFTGWSCSENATQGSFYCSYNDASCGG